jgi:hypothetical protein
LQRTRDGFFVGANFPADPKLIREETNYDVADRGLSSNARHVRWLALMAQYKGKIDVAAGQKFLADHYDSFEGKIDPDERTLCGHIDLSPRGVSSWWGPYGLAGAVQSKVADAASVQRMSLLAALGHSCGLHFKAAPFLGKHSEFAWTKDILGDMDSRPWTAFTVK